MGAAESSNVSEAVANVATFVSDSTVVNQSQASNIQNSINLDNCNLDAQDAVTITVLSNTMQQANQMVTSFQNASVANNISQEALQQATSKVGVLGIGYANASNSASQMVNDTTNIVNSLNASASQFQGSNNSINCDNSVIVAQNISIGITDTNNFLSQQTVNNNQAVSVVNDISQTVKQTATATVEGLGSLLFMLILIIGIIVWGLTKTLSSGSVKIATAFVVFALIAAAILYMYLRNTPPFFEQPIQCIQGSSIGLGSGQDGDTTYPCVDFTQGTIQVSTPPLRYAISLLPSSNAKQNLLQMAISAFNGQSNSSDNGGYRIDIMGLIANAYSNDHGIQKIKGLLGVSDIPNPLMDPSTTSGSYFAIPEAYMASLKGVGTVGSACTPGILQVVPGGCDMKNGPSCGPLGTTPAGTSSPVCPDKIDPSSPQLQTTTNTSNALATLNEDAWNTYLSGSGGGTDNPTTRAWFARFVLCYLISNNSGAHIDLNVVVNENEPVFFSQNGEPTYDLAINQLKNVYIYNPTESSNQSFLNAMQGGGVLSGQVGMVGNNMYKFNKFMKSAGKYILIGLGGIAVIVLLYNFITAKKDGGEKQGGTGDAIKGLVADVASAIKSNKEETKK